MKKYLIITLLFTVILFIGCSKESEDSNYNNLSYERTPIESVIIPDELIRGQNTEIIVSYFRPSDCHSFSGIDNEQIANEITISLINIVSDYSDCLYLEQINLTNKNFNFLVGSESSYVFKFWQGIDDQGDIQFLTIEVPVIDMIID